MPPRFNIFYFLLGCRARSFVYSIVVVVVFSVQVVVDVGVERVVALGVGGVVEGAGELGRSLGRVVIVWAWSS